MASAARLVLTEVLAAVRVDLGVADLSTVDGTPRAVIADGGHPPANPPYLLLSAPNEAYSYDNGAPLTEYHVNGELEWWVFWASDTDDIEARAFDGVDLATAVVDAVHAAHANPTFPTLYALTVLLCSWDAVIADEPEIPNFMPCIHGTIRYETDRVRGGG